MDALHGSYIWYAPLTPAFATGPIPIGKTRLNSMTTSSYQTKLYEYFSQHMPDIFSAIEEQYTPSEEEGIQRIKVNLFEQSEINNLYKSNNLIKSKTYSIFLSQEPFITGVNDIDDWINRPLLKSSRRKRYAFVKTALICTQNVVQLMTIILLVLDEMEKTFEESGEKHLFKELASTTNVLLITTDRLSDIMMLSA